MKTRLYRWPRRLAGATSIVAALALVAACGAGGREEDDGDGGNSAGGATDVGVTEDSITIGGTFPLTGVAAPGYSEIPTGAQAYFDFVNAAGGVHGREIEFLVKDDAYDPTKTSSLTNELVLKEQVFATVGSLGTPTHSAVVDFLNDEGVPDLFVSSGSLAWGDDPGARPMTFGWQPDYEIEGKIIGQYLAEEMRTRRWRSSCRTTTSARAGRRASGSSSTTRSSRCSTTPPATPTSDPRSRLCRRPSPTSSCPSACRPTPRWPSWSRSSSASRLSGTSPTSAPTRPWSDRCSSSSPRAPCRATPQHSTAC